MPPRIDKSILEQLQKSKRGKKKPSKTAVGGESFGASKPAKPNRQRITETKKGNDSGSPVFGLTVGGNHPLPFKLSLEDPLLFGATTDVVQNGHDDGADATPRRPQKSPKPKTTSATTPKSPSRRPPTRQEPQRRPVSVPVENLRNSDILCGSQFNSTHPGNKNLREIIRKIRRRAPHDTRGQLVSDVMTEVKSMVPPCRFLSNDPDTGLWWEIEDEVARVVIGRAICEISPQTNQSPDKKSRRLVLDEKDLRLKMRKAQEQREVHRQVSDHVDVGRQTASFSIEPPAGAVVPRTDQHQVNLSPLMTVGPGVPVLPHRQDQATLPDFEPIPQPQHGAVPGLANMEPHPFQPIPAAAIYPAYSPTAASHYPPAPRQRPVPTPLYNGYPAFDVYRIPSQMQYRVPAFLPAFPQHTSPIQRAVEHPPIHPESPLRGTQTMRRRPINAAGAAPLLPRRPVMDASRTVDECEFSPSRALPGSVHRQSRQDHVISLLQNDGDDADSSDEVMLSSLKRNPGDVMLSPSKRKHNVASAESLKTHNSPKRKRVAVQEPADVAAPPTRQSNSPGADQRGREWLSAGEAAARAHGAREALSLSSSSKRRGDGVGTAQFDYAHASFEKEWEPVQDIVGEGHRAERVGEPLSGVQVASQAQVAGEAERGQLQMTGQAEGIGAPVSSRPVRLTKGVSSGDLVGDDGGDTTSPASMGSEDDGGREVQVNDDMSWGADSLTLLEDDDENDEVLVIRPPTDCGGGDGIHFDGDDLSDASSDVVRDPRDAHVLDTLAEDIRWHQLGSYIEDDINLADQSSFLGQLESLIASRDCGAGSMVLDGDGRQLARKLALTAALYADENERVDSQERRNEHDDTAALVEYEVQRTEPVARKRVPKYVGLSDEIIFSSEILSWMVAVARERVPNAKNVHIRARDDTSDETCVVLEIRGGQPVMNVLKGLVTEVIRTKQLQVTKAKSPEGASPVDEDLDVTVDMEDVTADPEMQALGPPQKDLGSLQPQTRVSPGNDVSEASLVTPVKASMHDNQKSYHAFVAKFAQLRDIEFEPHGIERPHSNGAMWRAHSRYYGKVCDDDCECALSPSRLVETVVSDLFKKKRKKDPAWQSHLDEHVACPTGFASNFSAKFMKLLQREFPNEKPRQLLGRLFLMWDRHKGQKRFGLKCRHGCECGQAWEVVFLKGALQADEAGSASTGTDSSCRIQKRSSVARSSILAGIPRAITTTTYEPEHSRVVKPTASANAKTYDVTFACDKPLGIFVSPSKGKCRVFSIDPNVKLPDTRLVPGTILIKAKVGDPDGKWTAVKSPSDLESEFEKAKKGRCSLSIRCINTEATPRAKAPDHWGAWGHWKGPNVPGGWAGGAELLSISKCNQKQKMTKPRPGTTAEMPHAEQQATERVAPLPQKVVKPKEVPMHRTTLPLASVLKNGDSGKQMTMKGVRFEDNRDHVAEFKATDPTTIMYLLRSDPLKAGFRATDSIASNTYSEHAETPTESLMRLVRGTSDDFETVLDLLRNGADPTMKDEGNRPDVSAKRRGLTRTTRLLKTFAITIDSLKLVHATKHWTKLDIRISVRNLDVRLPDSVSNEISYEAELSSNADHDRPIFSGYAELTDNIKWKGAKLIRRFNSKLDGWEGGEVLSVSLFAGKKGSGYRCELLRGETFTLAELKRSGESRKTKNRNFSSGLASGELCVETSIRKEDAQGYAARLDHATGQLNKAMRQASSLKQDRELNSDGSLNDVSQICIPGTSYTLLHAAVQADNEDLMKWLIKGGANPRQYCVSTKCSPLSLAERRLEKVNNELRLAIEADVPKLTAKRKRLSRMLNVLTGRTEMANPSDERLDTEAVTYEDESPSLEGCEIDEHGNALSTEKGGNEKEDGGPDVATEATRGQRHRDVASTEADQLRMDEHGIELTGKEGNEMEDGGSDVASGGSRGESDCLVGDSLNVLEPEVPKLKSSAGGSMQIGEELREGTSTHLNHHTNSRKSLEKFSDDAAEGSISEGRSREKHVPVGDSGANLKPHSHGGLVQIDARDRPSPNLGLSLEEKHSDVVDEGRHRNKDFLEVSHPKPPHGDLAKIEVGPTDGTLASEGPDLKEKQNCDDSQDIESSSKDMQHPQFWHAFHKKRSKGSSHGDGGPVQRKRFKSGFKEATELGLNDGDAKCKERGQGSLSQVDGVAETNITTSACDTHSCTSDMDISTDTEQTATQPGMQNTKSVSESDRNGQGRLPKQSTPTISPQPKNCDWLHFDWMRPSRRICRFFASGCRNGKDCQFSHVANKAKRGLRRDRRSQCLPVEAIKFRKCNDYYTAGWVDDDNVAYYSQGGKCAVVNGNGVSLYRSRGDAAQALELLVIQRGTASIARTDEFAENRNNPSTSERGCGDRDLEASLVPESDVSSRSNSISSVKPEGGGTISDPPNKMPAAQAGGWKRNKPNTEREDGMSDQQSVGSASPRGHARFVPPTKPSTTTSSRNRPQVTLSVFNELTRGANFSAIYSFIMRAKPMRREQWTIDQHETTNDFHARFEAKTEKGVRPLKFQSKENLGGCRYDGKWWYRTEGEARASAFDDFLDYAVGKGFITEDKRRLSNGAGIRFRF